MNFKIQKVDTPVDSEDDSFVFVQKKNQKKDGKRHEYKAPALSALIKGFRKNTNRDPDYEENAKCVTYLTFGVLLIFFAFRFTDLAQQNTDLKVQNQQAMEKIAKLQQEVDKLKSFEDHWNIREIYEEPVETSGECGSSDDGAAKKVKEEKVEITKGGEEPIKMSPEEFKKRISNIVQGSMAVIYIAVLLMILRQMNNRRKRLQEAEKASQASASK